jgi:hypothetical protein
MSRHRSAVALLVFALSRMASGQSAQQGVPGTGTSSGRFQSPMILDTPFLLDREAQWDNKPRFAPYLAGFICEGVAISRLSMRGTLQRNKSLRIVLQTTLYTQPGVDRYVTLKYEVVVDGVIISTAIDGELDAEEGKTVSGKRQFDIPAGPLTSAASPPTLRITMKVRDTTFMPRLDLRS